MSIKLFNTNSTVKIDEIYSYLYPEGEINLTHYIKEYEAYVIYNGKLKEIKKDIYKVKNGIGDSFILKTNEKVYYFMPFMIKQFSSIQECENYILSLKE